MILVVLKDFSESGVSEMDEFILKKVDLQSKKKPKVKKMKRGGLASRK